MIAHESERSEEPNPAAPSQQVTLQPIVDKGADALAPDAEEKILAVRVTRMVMAWNNASHQVLTLEGDDVLRIPNPHAPRVPEGATLARVSMQFDLADTPEPASADLEPPDKAKISRPSHARRIASWLLKRHFALPGAALLNQFLIALAIALASCNAVFGDDSLDDDSDDDERESLSAPV
ncbi:MAG TPA: hypothetical protein VNZ64_25280 [Candidatus Acidoferrum sp.]|jgi:hypothetical protein|nr:hypothetical protein [Candidatus Acidoferrum sp.]